MKNVHILFLYLLTLPCHSQENKPTVKSILLEQLENTHNNLSWFVPINQATKDLTAKQANWKGKEANHSIAELVSHLIFWNERELMAFKGDTLTDFNNDNDSTFKKPKKDEWINSTKKLDSIQSLWRELVQNATENQLVEWSSEIANMCSHNAYHTGQIVFIRKQKGWWK